MGEEGNLHLKSIICEVPLICYTPSFSWGATTLIPDPRGPTQCPKPTKNATEVTRSNITLIGLYYVCKSEIIR